jgi:hypothetical protein
MSYFRDLTPYTFLTAADQIDPSLLNVGWLSQGQAYSTGPVEKKALEQLLRLCRAPVRLTRGVHRCGMCNLFPIVMPIDGATVALGNGEIRIAGAGGKTYAAPTLICHYIAQHEYCPPREFLDAVKAS